MMVQSGQNRRQSSQWPKVADYFVYADEAPTLSFLPRKVGSCLLFIYALLMLGKDKAFRAVPLASQDNSLLLR